MASDRGMRNHAAHLPSGTPCSDVSTGPFKPDAASCCTASLELWEGLLHTPHIRRLNGREPASAFVFLVYLLSSVQSSFTLLFATQQRQRQRFEIHNVIPSTSTSTMAVFTQTYIAPSCFNISP
jgi:hypothetical protein